MAKDRGRVILCKGRKDKDETVEAYAKILTSAGFACRHLPTLRFDFVNIVKLGECILTPRSYSGLILTSPRSVEAIGLAARRGESDARTLELWKTLPTYCVGPSTESLARKCLDSQNYRGAECGNVEKLATRIARDFRRNSKPLLYPCSEIARDTMENALAIEGIPIEKLVVYRTLPSDSLEDDLLEIVDSASSLPRIFVFFSPSVVEHVTAVFRRWQRSLQSTRAVAIGPVTGRALEQAGLEIYAVSEKPDPAALLEAIERAEEKQGS